MNYRERKIFCAYENKYSFMAMIKILSQCQEGVFFITHRKLYSFIDCG